MNFNRSDNIVSMTSFSAKTHFPMIAQVEGYWQALRDGDDIPRRAQLDPRGIEGALEHAFIMERIAPGVARIRLAGRHLNDLMGMEVRGMPLTAFFKPEARAEISLKLEEMFQSPAVVTMSLKGDRGIGKPALDGRLILLPLKSDLGDVSRALGCLVTNNDIGRAPRRFTAFDTRVEPLVGVECRPLGPGATPSMAPRSPAPTVTGMAESAQRTFQREAPAAPGPQRPARSEDPVAGDETKRAERPKSERPYLRLVK